MKLHPGIEDDKRFLIVSLKRLTNDEILQSSKSSVKVSSKMKASKVLSSTATKRKPESNAEGYMTRSKKSKTMTSSSNPISYAQKSSSKSSTTTKEPITVDSLPTAANTIALLPFQTGEIVWGKINGWPHWPAKITKIILPTSKRTPIRYEVYWFNDYRYTKIFSSQSSKFYSNYDEYSAMGETRIGLKTAVREAVMHIAAKLRPN